MAPVEDIFARDYYRCRYGYSYNGSYCTRNNWSYWGRWVLAGIVIFFFLLFFMCCLISRRRRSRGAKPVYGTGWMAAKPWGGNNNNHQMYNYGNQGGYNQGYNQGGYQNGGYGAPPPPPAYGQQQQPQYTGTTFNSNDGYYGQNQYAGVQAPQGTYQRDGTYSPPAGPPPGK
ncbi:hypothetical protein NW762_002259 [Fusarium torreyae]|uniref:Uncharacterized protein n=1 Tax=Fusarium torreyae TaxID=1237075 RepID=A0A9W8S9F9_9HYPO|nr:hypothetical protein NW762_002259 [Fusarium torreyae]